MRVPVWPTDFQHLHSEGADYWWWSPDTGPGWSGTWPADVDPPQGLMITCAEADDPGEWCGEEVTVSWEFGPETESGPFETRVYQSEDDVQGMIAGVMAMLEEERACAGTSV